MNWGFSVVKLPDGEIAIYEVYYGDDDDLDSEEGTIDSWVDDPLMVADDYESLLWVLDKLKDTVEQTKNGQMPLLEMSEGYNHLGVAPTAKEEPKDGPDENCLL